MNCYEKRKKEKRLALLEGCLYNQTKSLFITELFLIVVKQSDVVSGGPSVWYINKVFLHHATAAILVS